MSKLLFSLLFGSILFFSACKKDNFVLVTVLPEACELQTANPAGHSYAADSVVPFICTQKHCGILPLSSKNYWVYEDSVFNDGAFAGVQYDTLRYISNLKSLQDGLIWWESNISLGLPVILYANDSSFFGMEDRMFTPDIIDAKKDVGLFQGDSLKYLTSFEDAAAQGRSLKIQSAFKTPAGSFEDCLYFEKNARNYRRDQVYFKPGFGVVKYIVEKAPMGTRTIRLQQVSTLVAFHLE